MAVCGLRVLSILSNYLACSGGLTVACTSLTVACTSLLADSLFCLMDRQCCISVTSALLSEFTDFLLFCQLIGCFFRRFLKPFVAKIYIYIYI